MQEIDMIDGRGQGRHRMVKLAQVVGTECCHPDCEAPASASFDAKLPLCDRHYLAAYKAVEREITQRTKDQDGQLFPTIGCIPGPCPGCGAVGLLAEDNSGIRCSGCTYVSTHSAMRASRIGMFTTAYDATPVVYYILQGDLIKIGFSRSLRHRMNQLRPLDILGIELGSMDLERKRHRQFQGARSHGEYFIQTPELMDHINSLTLPEIPSLTVSAARDRGGLETP
ncbi:hypothetical protein [Gordonia paraffinivorans]|uniref:hypothetical protein n=1 Tax=Gordonia paraffinivorans TaxID=175628 RepID=UPI003FCDCEBF